MCREIEEANQPRLDGVLTNTKYNDKRKYTDDRLRALVAHFNEPRLQNSDLEKEDIFGDAYEYLLEQFADATKKKGGEFFTPFSRIPCVICARSLRADRPGPADSREPGGLLWQRYQPGGLLWQLVAVGRGRVYERYLVAATSLG